MIRYLDKTGLIEQGSKRIGQIDGKSIYKRLVPNDSVNNGMAHFHNGTSNRICIR